MTKQYAKRSGLICANWVDLRGVGCGLIMRACNGAAGRGGTVRWFKRARGASPKEVRSTSSSLLTSLDLIISAAIPIKSSIVPANFRATPISPDKLLGVKAWLSCASAFHQPLPHRFATTSVLCRKVSERALKLYNILHT
jgi:hypothetical protein